MNKNDGGSAFPNERKEGNYVQHDCGMSLRDYFAAKTMQAMLVEGAENYTFDSCAKASYAMADAMLAERSKP